ncbi:MAG: endonuclease V, partial [Thermodesulfovibrionales bacterium]
LVGDFDMPDVVKGAYSNLIYRGEKVGVVLRTKDKVAPLFLSVGHNIDLESSIEIILHLTRKYRIPIPQRYADKLTKRLREEISKR